MAANPPSHDPLLFLLRPPDRKVVWVSLSAAIAAHVLLGVAAFFSVMTREGPPPEPPLPPLRLEQAPLPPPPKPIARLLRPSDPVIQVAVPDPDPDAPEPIMIEEAGIVISPGAFPDVTEGWGFEASEPPGRGPVELTPDMTPPRIIAGTKVQPRYPARARRAGIEGEVILRAVIHRDGTVGWLEVVQTPPLDLGFSEEALAAVAQWRYHPARLGDRTVEVYFTILVAFRLDG